MERIVFEVSDSSGKFYQNLSEQRKKEFSDTIDLVLKKKANDANFADYNKLLDEAGIEAMKNGLTPEILEALLASDD